jgi:hypothetical protein
MAQEITDVTPTPPVHGHEATAGKALSREEMLAQYQVVAARRQNFDSMLWQVPALSLTAQAFLLVIALGSGSGHLARIAAGLLSAVTALMSAQLLLRQRLHEEADARWLHDFEDSHDWEPIHRRPSERVAEVGMRARGLAKLPSHQLWLIGLVLFGAIGLAAAVSAL